MSARHLKSFLAAARLARRPRVFVAVVSVGAVLLVSPAGAQYIAPGTATPADRVPPKESLERSFVDAPWTAGGLRLSPWLGIQDAAYVETTLSEEDRDEGDFTATLGAGLRGYLKTGSKVFWAAHALPEYVWWQDLEDKQRVNGRYGAGVFGYFNRLTSEVSWRRLERQDFFSSEVQVLTTNRRDISRLALALRVATKLELFAVGRLEEHANEEEESELFSRLDRDDETLMLGVGYRSPRGLSLALGVEDRTIDFAPGARDLSSSGTSEFLDLGYEGTRLELRARMAFESLEPEEGSQFRGFDETTGNLDLLWQRSQPITLLAYARRALSYSVEAANSHFVGDRFGARIGFRHRRFDFGLYAELGEDDFEPLTAADPKRTDDVTAVGAALAIPVGELLTLSLDASRTEYDSNNDTFDREVTALGITVGLGGVVRRLSLGEGGEAW